LLPYVRVALPPNADSKIGGRQASISSDKDNDGSRGRLFIKLNATPARRKMRADDLHASNPARVDGTVATMDTRHSTAGPRGARNDR
jgi:hypothetical protein